MASKIKLVIMMLEGEALKNYWNIFRLKIHLRSLAGEKDQGFLSLGKKVFQLLHNKELEREDLKEDVQEILSIEDEIDQVREALYREMGQPPRKQCQSCGKYIDAQARYCPRCGNIQERSKSE
jgi:rubrerythrin